VIPAVPARRWRRPHLTTAAAGAPPGRRGALRKPIFTGSACGTRSGTSTRTATKSHGPFRTNRRNARKTS
jgi:hypothetical protein